MRETVSTNITGARAAAGWLYLVAAATALNSLTVFKYGRFVDLIVGLSFTQLIDAVFVGMALEPRGAQAYAVPQVGDLRWGARHSQGHGYWPRLNAGWCLQSNVEGIAKYSFTKSLGL